MKLVKVDPKAIMVPEVRVTARFDPELYEMFKASIKETGQIAPIICCYVDQRFVLVDGLHRLQEALDNKQAAIDVALIDGDMTDVLTKNIFLDHLRGKTPISQMRKVIVALAEEYMLGLEDIVRKTGLPQGYVEKLLIISELTPKCLEELDQGNISVGHAAALARVKDPITQEKLLYQLLMYRMNVRDFEALVRDTLRIQEEVAAPQVATAPAPPLRIKCRFCQGSFEPFEFAPNVPCNECAALLFTTQAELRRLETQELPPQGKGAPPSKD